ncbi:MAG: hypothetical protein JO097_17170 [Acidobacteriaceae bacterium]|nr:hypothetical protein [Acidobacteriaceae bacterium]MBV9297185.1 hypothetical protein [Acidobacteriaceae bacterium]
MAELSVRRFLVQNRFDPAGGVRRLLPSAANGSLRYLLANFVFYADRLLTYQQLEISEQLLSSNNYLNVILQADGNLVLYRTQFGHALWASNTPGSPVNHVIMQGDGNLVAYSAEGTAYWATGTQGHPGAWAFLQDDGNFVVYDSGNNALWASNTVQDFNSPTFQYTDACGYKYDETSEQWKQLCTNFPCFALLQWPGYSTQVVDTMAGQPLTINGQPVVIQLWKGTCEKFLGSSNFPGGIGAEVGVYHRVPGRARPTLQQLLALGVPSSLATLIIAGIAPLTDDQLWWAFPELDTQVEFTLTNPITTEIFFTAGLETTYWLNKWMDDDSYEHYQAAQRDQTPPSTTDYLLAYSINGNSFPPW